jgi:hypothetical protein
MTEHTYIISVTFGEPDHAMESMGIMNIMMDRGFLPWRPPENLTGSQVRLLTTLTK